MAIFSAIFLALVKAVLVPHDLPDGTYVFDAPDHRAAGEHSKILEPRQSLLPRRLPQVDDPISFSPRPYNASEYAEVPLPTQDLRVSCPGGRQVNTTEFAQAQRMLSNMCRHYALSERGIHVAVAGDTVAFVCVLEKAAACPVEEIEAAADLMDRWCGDDVAAVVNSGKLNRRWGRDVVGHDICRYSNVWIEYNYRLHKLPVWVDGKMYEDYSKGTDPGAQDGVPEELRDGEPRGEETQLEEAPEHSAGDKDKDKRSVEATSLVDLERDMEKAVQDLTDAAKAAKQDIEDDAKEEKKESKHEQPKAKPAAKPEPKAKPAAKAKPKAKPVAKPKPKPKAKPAAEPEAKKEARPKGYKSPDKSHKHAIQESAVYGAEDETPMNDEGKHHDEDKADKPEDDKDEHDKDKHHKDEHHKSKPHKDEDKLHKAKPQKDTHHDKHHHKEADLSKLVKVGGKKYIPVIEDGETIALIPSN